MRLALLAAALLADALLARGLAAQSPERIADAIARLGGEREDARAIEVLIDAGSPAVQPLVDAWSAARGERGSPQATRLLRALRAMRGEAAADVAERLAPALLDAIDDERTRSPLTLDCAATLGELVWRDPGVAAFARTTVDWGRVNGLIAYPRGARLVRGLSPGAQTGAGAADGVDVFERWRWADRCGVDRREDLPRLRALFAEGNQPTEYTVIGPTFRARVRLEQAVADALVRDAASRAIARIAPDDPDARRGLAETLTEADDPRDRVRAVAALGRHGAAAAEHVDVVLGALDSDDDRLVAEAATSLAMIGVASDAVLGRLRQLALDERPAVAKRAAAAVRSLEQR